MGIYDREYYRGETRGSAWLTGLSPACKAIIIINVVAFFLPSFGGREFFDHWLKARPSDIFRHGYVWELVTATFLHAGPMHLAVNMLFLWFFGRELEAMYGSRDFTVFYLSAAAISTLGWAALEYARPNEPFFREVQMVGASGAIAAVVVVNALHFPSREMLLFFVIPIQMWLLVVLYLLFDAYQLFTAGSTRESSIAFASHLTGAGYGYLFQHFNLRWSRVSWRSMRRPRLRLVIPEPREKISPRTSSTSNWASDPATPARPTATAVVSEEVLDAKLDEVLAKIAREGRSGLTEEENRVLQEASKRARNRRSDRL